MKLYTEEQVRELLSNMLLTTEQVETILKQLTPMELPSDPGKDTADYIDRHIVQAMVEVAKDWIKLPSDEEIEEYANKYAANGAIINGAKWMKEQITKTKDSE